MGALEQIAGRKSLANAALVSCMLLAAGALYLGVAYYTLIGFPPDPFLDWFWPLSCFAVFALSLTTTTRLMQRIHRRQLGSAFFLSAAAILGCAVLLAAVFVSIALLRPVK
jgi:hypothetical protein